MLSTAYFSQLLTHTLALKWPKRTISSFEEYEFPHEDLMNNLIDHYFETFNALLPILHRPTFQALLDQHRHRTDADFAAVVLLVCAMGAKNDVVHEDPDGERYCQCTGWKWFEQVPGEFIEWYWVALFPTTII